MLIIALSRRSEQFFVTAVLVMGGKGVWGAHELSCNAPSRDFRKVTFASKWPILSNSRVFSAVFRIVLSFAPRDISVYFGEGVESSYMTFAQKRQIPSNSRVSGQFLGNCIARSVRDHPLSKNVDPSKM